MYLSIAYLASGKIPNFGIPNIYTIHSPNKFIAVNIRKFPVIVLDNTILLNAKYIAIRCPKLPIGLGYLELCSQMSPDLNKTVFV